MKNNLLCWSAGWLQKRALGPEVAWIQNIVDVPVNDLIGMRVFATGGVELAQLDTIRALISSSESNVGVPVDRRRTFTDVGANIDLYTLALSRLFNKTIALEADPATFKVLGVNLALVRMSGVQCICHGISDEAADATSYGPEDGNLGWATLNQDQHVKRPTIRIAIKLDPLDNLAKILELDKNPVYLIKIEVEGHEVQVLCGARKLLARWGPIVLFELLDDSAGARCVDVLTAWSDSRFYRFRRGSGWPGSGLKGVLTELTRGLPIRYELIDSASGARAPLVCAVRA